MNTTVLRTEFVLFARNPAGAIWTAVLPLAAVVVLGLVPAVNESSAALGGRTGFEVYLPILMMFTVTMGVINSMPPEIATLRERGVLRRLSTTPMPPSRLLAARAVIHVGSALLTAAVMLVLATAGFGVALPTELAGFALAIVLVAAAATGIATAVAALLPNTRITNAVSMVLFFPLMFLAGLWLPRQEMPDALRTVSDYSPLGAGADAVGRTLDGSWPTAGSLLVLAAYAIVLGVIGARTFRWH